MRCFIAIDVSDDARAALVAWMRVHGRSIRDVRWCGAEQMHITLHFLGEIAAETVTGVQEVCDTAAAATEAFSLGLDRIGAFPNPRAPRVLWAGIRDDAQACAALADRLRPGLEGLGIPLDRRSFSPHITLARSHGPGGTRALAGLLAGRPPKPDQCEFRVDATTIYESRLLPTGAEHRMVHRAALRK